jgi:hypothetical protein
MNGEEGQHLPIPVMAASIASRGGRSCNQEFQETKIVVSGLTSVLVNQPAPFYILKTYEICCDGANPFTPLVLRPVLFLRPFHLLVVFCRLLFLVLVLILFATFIAHCRILSNADCGRDVANTIVQANGPRPTALSDKPRIHEEIEAK